MRKGGAIKYSSLIGIVAQNFVANALVQCVKCLSVIPKLSSDNRLLLTLKSSYRTLCTPSLGAALNNFLPPGVGRGSIMPPKSQFHLGEGYRQNNLLPCIIVFTCTVGTHLELQVMWWKKGYKFFQNLLIK